MTPSTTKFSMTGVHHVDCSRPQRACRSAASALLALSLKLDAVAGVVLFVALQLLGLRAAQLSR